ncbi:Tigger transposable element-derived protein 4 [Pseudolycoriella hygida]|uniref:Tigger transposable element-derived protein 4 n=1 Tax=Pseudolycoriella hygida TaxID=35572 RepID=A0A9Q0MSK7_9DIPT|nr:Tigger transposable element-derived protein 4 [Pseudolycoriella hygida]
MQKTLALPISKLARAGWHQLSFKIMSGESTDVDKEAVNDWYKQLPNILKDFEPDDIFNMDETGLFFKCLPNKTLADRKEKCYGWKNSKLRLSVLVGANNSGTEKLKLLIIGKFRRPRCFAKNQQLPVQYCANKKSWMTSSIFEEYIMLDLDMKFQHEKRTVLFFVDNCPAHPKNLVSKLKAIKLVFFPNNMTSKVQPMDARIIKDVKAKYRTKIVNKLIGID